MSVLIPTYGYGATTATLVPSYGYGFVPIVDVPDLTGSFANPLGVTGTWSGLNTVTGLFDNPNGLTGEMTW